MSEQPETFGKYRILERIAVGGMAEIFRARLDGIGGFHRTFAIKRILPHLSARPEFVDMLVEEAKIAGLLSHANIVQIMDLGQVAGTYYIAMEYVDGPDLGRVLERCRSKGITLPVPHAVFIAIEVLKGLEYAHQRKVVRSGKLEALDVVHRDISPGNILVSLQGEVKLTDFGIAKASVKALETVAGVIKGRFDYMSPEQATAQKVDQRADLFSTGVVLYELLTGRHPFRQAREAATLDAIRDGQFVPVGQLNPDVPFALEQVVHRALSPDREKRWSDATQMKDSLDRFFHDAGFIFTHSTLAAFLKGLFPEIPRGNTEKARPYGQGGDTRPMIRGAMPDDEDPRATSVSDGPPPSIAQVETSIRPIPRPSLLDNLPDMSASVALGPVAGVGEEATLIRNNPLALDAEDDWSNANTRIRPSPLKGQDSAELELLEPDPEGWVAEAETRIRPTPRAEAISIKAPDAKPAPQPVRVAEAAEANTGPTAVQQLAYLAAGIVLTVLVLVVGILIGVRAGPMLTEPAGPGAAITFPMPKDTRLVVNDQAVDGGESPTLQLGPGTHQLRLEGPQGTIEARIQVDGEGVRELGLNLKATGTEAGK